VVAYRSALYPGRFTIYRWQREMTPSLPGMDDSRPDTSQ